MFNYAVLNECNICVGISNLSQPANQPNMIEIEDYSIDYIYRKFENDSWSNEKYEPIIEAPVEVSITERIDLLEQAVAELILGGVV